MKRQLTESEWQDAQTVWDFHQVHHELAPAAAAIALGCNDIGVADYTAELYHRGLFQVVVFTGATSRDTAHLFPRGEAVHFRERALELGVPDTAILVEPEATNTGANITLARAVLAAAGLTPDSVLLISMPYMERRAFATCRCLWPEVTPICTSASLTLEEYVKTIGNAAEVVDMMIGDLQRVMVYPEHGFAIPQPVPPAVQAAYDRLMVAGFDSRLLRS
ncbi:YdcF family protein [Amycolatopsis balhimycina DSM 5908]|uniref:YdcF family protein n=1 Tax=Amycolatopsis balhimycina DSM 5908 TaxID=1081091 RepID=A0A428W1C5_AMYBA|nr:YdcF family protein [Amycolatopsis balhimycina]RSM36878.1 YdcF family protein [Amycolatopsis balhimycina DSM 5908]